MITIILFSVFYGVLSLPLFRVASVYSSLVQILCTSGKRGSKRISSTKLDYLSLLYYGILGIVLVLSSFASFKILYYYYSTVETWYTFLLPLVIPTFTNIIYYFIKKK